MEETIKIDELEYALDIYCVYKSMLVAAKTNRCNVYKGWLLNFGNFYKWAKEKGFEKGQKVERTSRKYGYLPENTRIITPKRSANGIRNCDKVYIKYKEEVRSATDWSHILGIPRTTIYDRVQKGWTDEEVIEGRRKAR